MKITMESTSQIVEVNGIPARIWEGQTESGIPCFAMITRIGVHQDQDASRFESELKSCKPPTFTRSWPLSMFID
jgi:hypothetical protein